MPRREVQQLIGHSVTGTGYPNNSSPLFVSPLFTKFVGLALRLEFCRIEKSNEHLCLTIFHAQMHLFHVLTGNMLILEGMGDWVLIEISKLSFLLLTLLLLKAEEGVGLSKVLFAPKLVFLVRNDRLLPPCVPVLRG